MRAECTVAARELAAPLRTAWTDDTEGNRPPCHPGRGRAVRASDDHFDAGGQFRQVVVLRVAWALADLAGRTVPGRDEVAEALGMRLQRVAA